MNKDENRDENKGETLASSVLGTAGGAEYTRLTDGDVDAIMERARDNALPFICSADFDERAGLVTVEEHVERPGTFFIDYVADTWRKAEAFCAAVYGAAWALGHFAEVQVRWSDRIGGGLGGSGLVSVYVAAADVMDEDGHAVA